MLLGIAAKPAGKQNAFLILVSSLALLVLVTGTAAALDLSTDNPPSSTPVISQGDSVYVHGTATGHPQQGLQVWVIGNNYARVSTVSVDTDNTFEYEITKADTLNMASGQYFVLVQHPMMNGQFDITYNAGTGEVVNRQLGGGTAIFQLTGSGSLQGPAAASALVQAVADQNIDDTFTTVSFSIQPPNAFIEPIAEHAVGDRFTISGTTNLAAGDKLMVEVYSSSFMPTSKAQSGEFSGASGIVGIQAGASGLNTWSFDVDASGFRPDEYIVTASGITQDVTGSATFTIVEKSALATTATSAIATAVPETTGTTVPEITQALPATTQKSPAGIWTALAVAPFALVAWRRRSKV